MCKFLAFIICLIPILVDASTLVTGSFKATRNCEAYQSFKSGSNPGVVKLDPGSNYVAVEVNKVDWNWIRLELISVPLGDNRRWVSRSCGIASIDVVSDQNGSHAPSACTREPNQHDSNVLAISWQPGFCEWTNAGTGKPECIAMARGELHISNLTLHGLWPNLSTCRSHYVSCENGNKTLSLDESTIESIAPWMPNFYFSNAFGQYEWAKHGTCQSLSDDEYFLLSVELVKRVDESAIGQFVKSNIGQLVSVIDFYNKIKTDMGEKFAKKVELQCAAGKYLQEIRISLIKDISTDFSLNELIASSLEFTSFQGNCGNVIEIEKSGN